MSRPVHGERKCTHAVTAILLVGAPLPRLIHPLTQHVQGHVTTQCHLCQLPILQEKRDLVTRHTQPDDVQRIVAHIAFSGATGRREPQRTHFRLPTKLRLHSPTLDSLGSTFSIRLPNQGRDIHRLFLLPQLRARR